MAILVTGGAGFIGSHTVVELQNAGYDVVVVDNLSNASVKSLQRVEKITGKPVTFYKADILDRDALEKIFAEEEIDSCIHFAGLKAVGESVQKPWEYYNNNIAGTLTLVDVMRKHGCKNIIFSSSATVYGDPAFIPITEECPKGQCTNPYGWTKSMLEQILSDMQKADPAWNVILLRYFNPIGAHQSGTMGENPNGIPNNLMPYITQVAVGKLERLGVFGNDYDTHDGTGVRDYIHVVDLAVGHVKALKKIEENAGLCIYNLGTGTGYSVLDIVKNFEEATGVPAISRPAMRTRRRRRRSLAGQRSTVSGRCARTAGDGSPTILTDMMNSQVHKKYRSFICGIFAAIYSNRSGLGSLRFCSG